MKYTHLLKPVMIFSFILILASCANGGDNGSDTTPTPTDPNQSFTLAKLQSTTPGTVYSSQLTGRDSDGLSVSGSISMANRAQTMLNGVLVIPREAMISLNIKDVTFTVTSTGYIDTSGNLISMEIQTTGVMCTPVSPDTMPTAVKIGDFGILSTLTCTDNTTTERNWRVEDAGNGTILITTNSTVKDQSNRTISVTDVMFTLDGDGNIVAFKTMSSFQQSTGNFWLSYESV